MNLPDLPITGIAAGPAIRSLVSLKETGAGIFRGFSATAATEQGLCFHDFLTVAVHHH
jgi:hypothetical protein